MGKIEKIFLSAVFTFLFVAAVPAGVYKVYSQNVRELKLNTPKKTETEQKNTDTLKSQVGYLAGAALMGRGAGTKGELETARYIFDYLQSNGVLMISPRDGEDFKIVQSPGDTLHSRNIIGIVPGYDKSFNGEYILIGAHMDGLGCTTLTINGKKEQVIYPGADKNASGVAVLMQVAKMVAQNKFMFKRSVIFAFFGAGELGMAGSWYFLNRSFSEVDKITLMVDLDAVGYSGDNNKLQVFTGVPNPDINDVISNIASRPFSVTPALADKEPFGSDYRNFYQKDIPAVLFTTGVHPQLNSAKDTPDILDYLQMNQIAEFVYSFSLVAATREQKIDKGIKAGEAEVGGKKEMIYTQNDVDHRALFLRGDERTFLKEWVYQYIKYPDSAIAEGLEGTERVEFVVDKNGSVKDVKVIKSLSEEIDNEVIKVFKASPKWKPAILNGSPVNVKIVLPVEFILTNKKSGLKIKK